METGRSLQDLKDEIRARNDIVDVIGQYTRLKRSGKNWTGLCPFHPDKNPSFNVSPGLQIYKCFSCGEKGDVFTFVQKKENLDFVESMEFLARRAGIPFEWKQEGAERSGEREAMFALNEFAMRFFRDRLAKSETTKEYLVARRVLRETQERFQLGFAPDDWEALAGCLDRNKKDLALAARLGLIKPRTEGRGGFYDAFRNRLIFPIHDVNGRVIAFGGRAMGDDRAKYLNSEETPLFNKSRTLYGVCFARKAISGDRPAVFVEGYMDVITAHQAGFPQCVATLGTAMTEDHARALARYNPHVVICYDADAAGTKATLRGAEVWEKIGVEGAEVRVARLPDGEDPDSLLRRGDTAAFQAALDNAVPRADFEIDLALAQHDLETEEGRDAALDAVIPILASIGSRSLRGRYAQRLAYLHPLHFRQGGERAIEMILADAEAAARGARRPFGRAAGYPLTTQANGQPLTEQPGAQTTGAMVYTPRRGRSSGRGPSGGAREGRADSGPSRVTTDGSRPSLEAPALTAHEKVERQVLRALFAPDWRAYILANLDRSLLASSAGQTLFDLVGRCEAAEDGGVDLQALQRSIETLSDPESNEAEPGAQSKLSEYLRELMEDSPFYVSKEGIDEAVVRDCIRRLSEFRHDQIRRDLIRSAQNLPPEQRRTILLQAQEKIRQARRSAPDPNGPDEGASQ